MVAEQSSAKKINDVQICLNTLSGETITLDFTASGTIDNVRIKIQDDEGIFPIQQKLIFASKHLEEGCTLSDYNVRKKMTVHMTARLRRGMTEG